MTHDEARQNFQEKARALFDAAIELENAWQTDDWSADEDAAAYGHYPSYLPSFDEFVYDLGNFCDAATKGQVQA